MPARLVLPAVVLMQSPALEPIDTEAGAIPISPDGWNPPPSLAAEPDPAHLGDKILFVNFDGGDMNFCGGNDPVNNCSTIFQGTVLPYSGDDAKRAAVIQSIRQRVDAFGITVTDLRPDAPPYDMEMVGNWQGESPGFAGVAPSIDCWDDNGPETSFTLEVSGTPDGIGEIVLQEVAHTWGLEHVDAPGDLLFPTTSGSQKQFVDDCYQIVSDTMLNPSGGYCNSVHSMFCGSGQQNSYQELLLLFGESIPDTIAPTVTIVAPTEGAMLDSGDVELVVAVEDDQHPAVLETTVLIESPSLAMPVETGGAYAGPSELAFPINGLPDGDYTVTVDILDESANPASAQVHFSIGQGGAMGESDGGGSATTGGDSADAGTGSGVDSGPMDGSGEAGDTSGDDGGQDDTAKTDGCGCRPSPSPTPPAWLALPLLVLRRRRQVNP